MKFTLLRISPNNNVRCRTALHEIILFSFSSFLGRCLPICACRVYVAHSSCYDYCHLCITFVTALLIAENNLKSWGKITYLWKYITLLCKFLAIAVRTIVKNTRIWCANVISAHWQYRYNEYSKKYFTKI